MGRRKLGILALTFMLLIIVAGFIATPVLDYLPQLKNRYPYGLTTSAKPGVAQSVAPHQEGTGNSGPGGCTAQSPYGFTTINANAQLVTNYKELNVCWVRFQVHEASIQTAPGVYNWSRIDTAVALLNAADIHIDFPIQCFGGSCFSNPALPTVAQMAQYATALAWRYDGKHGHGIIDAFEIGNEEYDFFPPSAYGPLLKAGYQAVKAVYPSAIVGMYGSYRPYLPHVQAVMSALANGYSNYFDFANFHYYAHGGDPRISALDHPSFNAEWQAIHAIFPTKPIWVTEVGWTTTSLPGIQSVSPQTQATYLQYVTQAAATSGVVQRMFWFTIDYGNQGDTIYPPGGPLPAYYMLQVFIQQRPQWT
jgi:hypothetical protein